MEGTIVSDIVKFVELNFGQQEFGVATSLAEHENDKFDGVIGLGFHSFGKDTVKPFIESFKTYFDEPQFTIVLNNDIRETGTITFGRYDNVECAGNVSFITIINTDMQWEGYISGYTVGNHVVNREQRFYSVLNFDFHMFRKQIITSLAKQINTTFDKEYAEYVVDCKTIDTFPVISFNINGLKYSLKGYDYTVSISCYFNNFKNCYLLFRVMSAVKQHAL